LRSDRGCRIGETLRAWQLCRQPLFDGDASPAERPFSHGRVGPTHNLLAWTFVVSAEARQGRLSKGDNHELVSQLALFPPSQSNVECFADRQDHGIENFLIRVKVELLTLSYKNTVIHVLKNVSQSGKRSARFSEM
jgi:hypothetical protein